MNIYHQICVWPELRPYVAAIQVQDASETGGADVAPEPVVPTPFPVLGFQFRGRLAVVRNDHHQLLERSGITLLQSTMRRFQPLDGARSVLVVLHPAAAYTLLGRPLHELADQHVGLAAVLGSVTTRAVLGRLVEARTTVERGSIMQRYLLSRFEQSAAAPHPVVEEAVQRMLLRGGRLRVRSLADELGVSERQLERLFREQVGSGPKRFGALVQFDWAWQRIRSGLSWSALAGEAGYADQAHLTRTFVQRTGLPPRQLLVQSGAAATP